jgi:hypothetical protein
MRGGWWVARHGRIPRRGRQIALQNILLLLPSPLLRRLRPRPGLNHYFQQRLHGSTPSQAPQQNLSKLCTTESHPANQKTQETQTVSAHKILNAPRNPLSSTHVCPDSPSVTHTSLHHVCHAWNSNSQSRQDVLVCVAGTPFASSQHPSAHSFCREHTDPSHFSVRPSMCQFPK